LLGVLGAWLHGTRGDGSDRIIPGMHLVEERMHSTDLRFPRCFGVVGRCGIEFGVYFVEGAGFEQTAFLQCFL
jgi:hypothetical protein